MGFALGKSDMIGVSESRRSLLFILISWFPGIIIIGIIVDSVLMKLYVSWTHSGERSLLL